MQFFEGIKTGLIQDGKVGIYKTMTLEVKIQNHQVELSMVSNGVNQQERELL